MIRRRSHRVLSAGEEQLWREVVRFVRPMGAKRSTAALDDAAAAAPPPVKQPSPEASLRPLASQPPVRKAKATPPLAPLERKLRRDLVRGHVEIDGKLDLHGMRQHEAHMALRRFLTHSHEAGARLVIVVTGKGVASEYDPESRGVLKRQLPHWLSALELRSIVVGFDQASDKHGGGGAFYVRLRSHRARERLGP